MYPSPLVRAIPLSFLAALLLLTFAPSGRPDSPVGEQRLLVLRLTWGLEQALSEAEIARSVERASAHVGESSYGKTWLTHETTRWLHAWSAEPSTCDYSQLSTFTNEAARQSGSTSRASRTSSSSSRTSQRAGGAEATTAT